MKIYFYKTDKGKVVDADEQTAWTYHKMKYKYLGWSDGRFLNEFKMKSAGKLNAKYDKDTGMMKKMAKEVTDGLKEVWDKELEFAAQNPDKTGPRDFSKQDLDGKILDDPKLKNVVGNG